MKFNVDDEIMCLRRTNDKYIKILKLKGEERYGEKIRNRILDNKLRIRWLKELKAYRETYGRLVAYKDDVVPIEYKFKCSKCGYEWNAEIRYCTTIVSDDRSWVECKCYQCDTKNIGEEIL